MSQLTQQQRESDVIGYYDVPPMVEILETYWELGPLDVSARLISPEHIEITIKVEGVKIASGIITAGNDRLCAGANVGMVKVSVHVIADFPNKTVWVEGEFCTKTWSTSWDCDEFKRRILSW